MLQVAILTPEPGYAGEDALWEKVLARLQRALAAEGIEGVALPWTEHLDEPAPLAAFACVLPLLAWGYHRDRARWLRACQAWERAGLAVCNPPRVLAWNGDKRYLLELQARGVAIPPTLFGTQFTAGQLQGLFAASGAGELILKPAVSAGAWQTRRLRPGEEVGPQGMDMLVQPYLDSIESEGETSLLYFGGRLSHVVNKRPVPGDFRVQEEFGGQYRLLDAPPAGARALAEAVLEAVGEPLLYARIDVVPDRAGRWLLMEAELIEPDFYLGMDPAGGAGFAAALRAHLERARA